MTILKTSSRLKKTIESSIKSAFIDLIFWYVITFLIIFTFMDFLDIGKDSTDGETRSGMSIHIDTLTGCEYLQGSRGGLTPRMTRKGNHKGCNYARE